MSDVDSAGQPDGAVTVAIPELLADEVRHVVVGVRLASRPVALDAPVTVADVEVAFERMESGRPLRETSACKVLARFVEAAQAQATPDPELDRVVAIAQLVRVQLEAEEAARRGRWEEAHQVVTLFQRAVRERGHGEVAEAAGRLAGSVRDPTSFRSSTAYRSSLKKGATRSVGSTYQADAEADLRAMGRGQSTAAQRRMERSFAPASEAERKSAPRLDRKRSRRW